MANLLAAVRELESRMLDRREFASRAESIETMTELQLREEKAELQRELLILEGMVIYFHKFVSVLPVKSQSTQDLEFWDHYGLEYK